MSDDRSEHKLVVITGGGGGLGQVLADLLRGDGWDVRAPGRAEMDVTSPDAVAEFFRDLPRCDALINNAGITRDMLVARMSEKDWDAVVQCCLDGAWRCSKAALPLMCRMRGEGHARGGQLVHVGSHVGRAGGIGQAAYAAAKAGLIGLSASLAREYGGSGIASNVVLPGWMDTPMTARASAAARAMALRAHVLGRFTTPVESAGFIRYLLSTQSISGQVFALDSRPVSTL